MAVRLHLREIKAEAALASGVPGLIALVRLLDGCDPAVGRRAARETSRMMPKEQVYDLEAILWLLARSRFSFEKFAREVGPKEMDALLGLVVRSPLWQSAVAQGEARARAELLAADRELCLEIVSRHHPALLAKVAPCIEACKDPSRLDAWILAASEQDPEALASMAGLRPAGPGTGRR